MLVIVYTDTNMTEFLKTDLRNTGKAIVDPLFKVLEANLDQDLYDVAIMNAGDVSAKTLNRDYLIKNKAVLIPQMAASWPALEKWQDKQYFID